MFGPIYYGLPGIAATWHSLVDRVSGKTYQVSTARDGAGRLVKHAGPLPVRAGQRFLYLNNKQINTRERQREHVLLHFLSLRVLPGNTLWYISAGPSIVPV